MLQKKKYIFVIILVLLILIYRYINYSPNVRCKNWDKIINEKEYNLNYSKKKKNIGFLINGFGKGHLTQANTMYKILTNLGYNINIIYIFSNKKLDLSEYSFYDCKIITKLVNINDELAGNLDTMSIIYYFLFNIYNNTYIINKAKYKYKIDLWISFFAPVINTNVKLLMISRQSSHKNSIFSSRVLNYFISYNLIHVSILSKNIHSDYWIPSLIDSEKIKKNNTDNICVAYYSFNGPFLEKLKIIAGKNKNFKIYLFNNNKINNLPENIIIKKISKNDFRYYLSICSCVLCTSGNELIQECVFNYIPGATIPSNKNNWEQIENFNFYCNELNYSEPLTENIDLDYLSNKNVKDIGDKFNNNLNNRNNIINKLIKQFV